MKMKDKAIDEYNKPKKGIYSYKGTVADFLKEIGSKGGKKRWANMKERMTEEERSEQMKKVRAGEKIK